MDTKVGTRRLEVAQDGSVRIARRKLSATAWAILALLRLARWVLWRLPRGMARRGWRHRWHLAPLAGAWWVLTSGPAAPVLVLAITAAAALLAVFGGKTRIRLGERLWMSQRERYALAEGAIGAAVWTAGEWVAEAFGAHLPLVATAPIYALFTGHAAAVWWWSRRPTFLRREPKDAKHYTGQWGAVAATGTALGSSYIRRDTIEVLRTQDVTFRARLGDDHHAEDVGENERRAVERLIKGPGGADLPERAVTITRPGSTVNEVQVTISPQRAAENEPVAYPGLEPLRPDGAAVVSREPSGKAISVHRWGPTGVRFGVVVGGSDGGKSSTLRALMLRGPVTLNDRGRPIETVWSLDGGVGTSTPELAPAWDINAIMPWQFPIVFEAFYAVHLGRLARRGNPLDPRSSWRTWEEDDQILTLLLQETPGLMKHLTGTHDRMFADMLQRLRKLGMSVIVETQEITRWHIPGGQEIETVRNQLFSNGFVLAHRAGRRDDRVIAGSDEAQRLTRQQNSLPAGGGWHIAMEQGQLLSPKTRSLWAPPEVSLEAARSVAPRPLEWMDLEAAMKVPGFKELYEHRHEPEWRPPAPDEEAEQPDEALTTGPRPFVPVQPARELADARVLRAITEHMAKTGEPLGKTVAGKEPPDGYGIPGATWELGRGQLVAAGKIHQPEPGKWAPVFPGGQS